ncbi:hypothetical protein HCEG_01310 [Histoplasma capsulatum var. duboisii H88]|uniref:Uncharacterized protein n=2 Tax=Ajellomyces capsulatus TaxID=5037 RepID=F0U9Q9_AJEC8|nr:hypothetical protein HCDG_00008 [Histoplasma capsulatum H143]EGC41948.1 hypothetical protein HCEG_01310 [Histoplasma capsulatum var. duboisii H88]
MHSIVVRKGNEAADHFDPVGFTDFLWLILMGSIIQEDFERLRWAICPSVTGPTVVTGHVTSSQKRHHSHLKFDRLFPVHDMPAIPKVN